MKYILLLGLIAASILTAASEESEVKAPLDEERFCAGWQKECKLPSGETIKCCDDCSVCRCNPLGGNCTCNERKASCSGK
uniref:Venom gland peptide U8-PHTX-Pmx1c n=1 Tax=Physocyclus mexicanus TaxID=1705800 RepID=A0A6B9KDY9_9ARAC|nr:venom gland peptide U8-PHTX-Pmx1c [Physocyclus mexicanus]